MTLRRQYFLYTCVDWVTICKSCRLSQFSSPCLCAFLFPAVIPECFMVSFFCPLSILLVHSSLTFHPFLHLTFTPFPHLPSYLHISRLVFHPLPSMHNISFSLASLFLSTAWRLLFTYPHRCGGHVHPFKPFLSSVPLYFLFQTLRLYLPEAIPNSPEMWPSFYPLPFPASLNARLTDFFTWISVSLRPFQPFFSHPLTYSFTCISSPLPPPSHLFFSLSILLPLAVSPIPFIFIPLLPFTLVSFLHLYILRVL